MQNDLQDKCGVIGIYSPDENVEVAPWILSGLHTIQHRGQESAGISVIKNGIVNTHVGMGLVADVFSDNIVELLNGHMGVGHVRYSTTGTSSHENCSPFVEETEHLQISMAQIGRAHV